MKHVQTCMLIQAANNWHWTWELLKDFLWIAIRRMADPVVLFALKNNTLGIGFSIIWMITSVIFRFYDIKIVILL